MHLANLQSQIDVTERVHAAEAFRYAGHLQKSRQGSPAMDFDRAITRPGPHSRPERPGMQRDEAVKPV
jgi:hypothetical protein